MDEPVIWQPLLRDSLAALAATPEEQIKAQIHGCISCDLSSDFWHARLVAIQHGNLSDAQTSSLNDINQLLDDMEAADIKCFNNDVLNRPAWRKVSDYAKIALHLFGWQHATIGKFIESSPGIWWRPPSEG
jgi:hypothetical protein